MKLTAVIPARYDSTRMPGKPIMDICGRPMIWWVYKQVCEEKRFDNIVVATDDKRIWDVCKEYNLHVVMTNENHNTPTSRLYEVSTIIDSDLYILIMGDEPLVNAKCFDLIIPKSTVGEMYVGVLSNTIQEATEVVDFSNQKVVTNSKNEVLFISRSPIPYPKGFLDYKYEKVTGVQVFSKKALLFFNNTSRSNLEKAEENDLMRFVENSIPVKIMHSPYKTISVDTPKDLELVRNMIFEKIARGELTI